ncbi:MAG TPA: VCBS repeat-containing protein, partial [Planctomycetaceae bacterium]|nr:VCBS repeat-containing protein [Planctomycetaceae bacterium]
MGVVVLSLGSGGCGGKPAVPTPQSNVPKRPDPQVLIAQTKELCGSCHAMPRADTFPQAAWPAEIEQGLRFYTESGRHDLKIPPKEFIESIFQRDAPRAMLVPPPFPNGNPNRVIFEQQPLGPDADAAIAHLRFVPERGLLLAADMRSGSVSWLNPRDAEADAIPLVKMSNPAHIEPCDLDGDGVQDFVVAELGSFLPEDHHDGAVVWVRADGDNYATQILDRELGRVADVQPADINGDGRLDLVVAEFGWRTTGRILWLEQHRDESGNLTFERHVIDDRHGTIHVPVADLDGDGDLDFVALIAQEHEVIEAFFNDGKGSFRKERI